VARRPLGRLRKQATCGAADVSTCRTCGAGARGARGARRAGDESGRRAEAGPIARRAFRAPAPLTRPSSRGLGHKGDAPGVRARSLCGGACEVAVTLHPTACTFDVRTT
jgi:hypothetical protein